VIVVDTAVWVDFFPGNDLLHVRLLTKLVDRDAGLCLET
jgi:hypothetical protein